MLLREVEYAKPSSVAEALTILAVRAGRSGGPLRETSTRIHA